MYTMRRKQFTLKERRYLESLDAVERATSTQIFYTNEFKASCMVRYRAGEKPSAIFASVGLPSSLIGYKRIERAIYHWKELERKGRLAVDDVAVDGAADVERASRADSSELQKSEGSERLVENTGKGRGSRNRTRKSRSKAREEKVLANTAAQIAEFQERMRIAQADGALVTKDKRTLYQTAKSEKFELINMIKTEDASFNISAACKVLGVSRRGYYDWVNAASKRALRED